MRRSFKNDTQFTGIIYPPTRMFMFRNERSIAKANDNDNDTLPVFICGFIIKFAFQKNI